MLEKIFEWNRYLANNSEAFYLYKGKKIRLHTLEPYLTIVKLLKLNY